MNNEVQQGQKHEQFLCSLIHGIQVFTSVLHFLKPLIYRLQNIWLVNTDAMFKL